MRSVIKYTLMLLAAMIISACENDGDTVVATGFQAATLTTTATEVVLGEELGETLVLQLEWDHEELNVSNGYKLGSSAVKTTVQYATDPSFGTVLKKIQETSSSLSYTGSVLNSLVLGMGFKPGEASSLYARVESVVAANKEAVYSNTVAISVTPYESINDADYLYMATTDLSSFPWKLCSRSKNGFYDGFVKVDQWYNFYLTNKAGSGVETIFGSYPADGNQYVLYPGSDRWNCWTSNGGWLYMTADVNKLTWSETVVSSLSVVGDFNGWSTSVTPMTYDNVNKVWTALITTTVAEPWGVKVLVNESWSFFFGASDEESVCNLYKSDGSGFPYTVVGTYTLKLDLSDPKAFTYTIE